MILTLETANPKGRFDYGKAMKGTFMSGRRNPPLVLVADDEPTATIMLQRIFEREGYQVKTVNDGIEALAAARELLPDLVLLDIRMPGMNGFEVLKALREHPSTAGLPTILITANAREPSDVAFGLNLGADDYMYKPFAPQELIARAESKMKARQLEEALQQRTEELAALLQLSEDLIQHLERDDLLQPITARILDLLPGEYAAILQLNEHAEVVAQCINCRDDGETAPVPDAAAIRDRLLKAGRPLVWPEDEPLLPQYGSGMAALLQHGDETFGVLIVASNHVTYNKGHLRLFQGASRQAGLALRNAILHEIQVQYALHLEDMVAERTAELKSAQQMLIRSEKLASIGHLAANIAHEINNPLQPIMITLDDLVETVQNNMPVDIRGIEIIQESVERIRRIVSQLLEFTGKRSSGPDFSELDLQSILERIVALNRKFFEKEGMSIELDVDELPPVHGSKDQLEQVFMNLTLNAQAAMSRNGVLKISARAEGDHVVIQFRDNGAGIPPDQIDRIFDPFYSTKANGTGLGLFVSYGIIEGHHGKIEAESEVNVGTTFTIHLPISEPAKRA